MKRYSNQAFYEYLDNLGLIDKKQLLALHDLSEKNGKSLVDLIEKEELMGNHDLGRIAADFMGLAYVDLTQYAISSEILGIIPELVAKKQRAIAIKQDKEGLHLATSNPTNQQFFELLAKKVGQPILIRYATDKDIEQALGLYLKDINQSFAEIIQSRIKASLTNEDLDSSASAIIDTLIEYAYHNSASDIHIEPLEDKTLVRFRIDGIMHDTVELPLDLHEKIVNRVKVLSQLRTDEKFIPQDGKINTIVSDKQLDIRVSIIPTTGEQKVVMRLLADYSHRLSLEDLGMREDDLKKLKIAYQKSYGMILVTGPTGSGKTTTLYSILKLLNKPNVNITTIEDPVEYDIERVSQIQINEKTGLTFASGLRSIVRQDPDIILIGEIRDEETAEIAVNSSMTGHLLLSTLHTNDAPTAIPRLVDLKVKPFLISSSLNAIVAQRLVRKICPHCRVSIELKFNPDQQIQALEKDNDSYALNKSLLLLQSLPQKMVEQYFPINKSARIYYGKGCDICHQSGYLGRVGIFEIMSISPSIQEAIKDNQTAMHIQKLATQEGMNSMLLDGLEKTKQGITTIEEVVRVINR